MVNCCVPMCTASTGRKKELLNGKTISFHEFPCDSAIKNMWIHNIQRKDWYPSDRSCVCSKHFIENDYQPNCKIRKLKPTAVPSVFDLYPDYLKVAAQKNKPRKEPPVRKTLKTNANNVDTVIDSVAMGNFKVTDTKNLNTYGEEVVCLNIIEHIEKIVCTSSIPISQASSTSSRSPDTLKILLRKAQIKANNYNHRYRAIKNSYDDLLKKYKALEETKMDLNIDEIRNDAISGNIKANFLQEQMLQYKSKKPRWCEAAIRHCLVWRLKSPCSYEYCRQTLLTLPSKSTLHRATGASSGEIGITSPIKQQLQLEERMLQPEF